ncbi:hypothetical protein [Actinoplanes friuliensis]|uniref:Uncharacterized protein n=1 Tax=Actinoplanes friuliensis DSM 7358 TaxID=1246995 RepID=U5WC18_9ACTN|nr:hypothetical protein [Actinoplanes friuliensis]AGZ45501.1 hypothetical protein AFR_36225 [Actinoplanes friuliensis DSM 7358]
MEGHRRYAEEPEPSWYTGQRPSDPAAANAYDSGVYERPSGAFRLPEQRPADPYATPAGYSPPDPVTTSGSHALSSSDSGSIRMPVRGPEYPTVRPTSAAAADPPAVSTVTTTTTYGSGVTPESPPPAYNQPTSMVPMASAAPKRPVSALVFAVLTVVLLIPAVLLLVQATFVDDPASRGIVPAVLLTLGLPMTGLGLYTLAGIKTSGRDAWLRPPLVYLPIGLILLLAAGLGVA